MKGLVLLISSAFLLATLGCGDSLGETRGLAQGFTPCGDFLAPFAQSVTCHPNQYCANVTFSNCELGCLSNYNCSDDQFCIKEEGTDIGSCQATTESPL